MSDSAFRTGPDEEWEALMRQLQDQPQVQPRPFFYNRVSARLTTRAAARTRPLPGWWLRPAYAALLGVVMLVLSGDARGLRTALEAAPAATMSSVEPLSSHPQ